MKRKGVIKIKITNDFRYSSHTCAKFINTIFLLYSESDIEFGHNYCSDIYGRNWYDTSNLEV